MKALKKSYGKKQALKGVNLTLGEGVHGLLGPNGAGKSTMMNIITGNLPPSGGRVLLDGLDVRTLGRAFRSRVGYMPQQQAFYPGFSVDHFLFYIASLRDLSKKTAKARIDWSLRLLGLEDVRSRPIRALSGGMRQRLLLAQAVLADPDILILDEPTAGLDPRQRIAVRNLIAEIAEHKIVLISTHVVPDVEFIANRIILLSEGELLCQMTPHELTEQLQGQVWETLIAEKQLPALRACGPVCAITRDSGGVLVRSLSARAPTERSVSVRPSLEDIYLYYFGEPDLS